MIVSIILLLIFSFFLPVSAWAQFNGNIRLVSRSYYQNMVVTSDMNNDPVSDTPSVLGLYSVGVQDLSWKTTFSPYFVQVQVYFPMECTVKCPVVIYSHGLGGTRSDFAYLAKRWASRGIITVLLEHPGSNIAVWKGKLRPWADLRYAYNLYWSGRDRAQLMNFVINQMDELSKTDDCLGKIINPDKFGVAGNDLGALGALLVSGQLPPDNGACLKNDKVKAVLALSPPIHTTTQMANLVYAEIKMPFMSCSGTEDDGKVGTTKSYQRRIPFDSLDRFDSYHVTLFGADHQVYGGHQFKSRAINDSLYQQTLQRITTIFWGAWLLDDLKARDLLAKNCSDFLFAVGKMEHGRKNSNISTVQQQEIKSKKYF